MVAMEEWVAEVETRLGSVDWIFIRTLFKYSN